jgi:peptidoglycan/xylan/chitin deacetylase (PgdA/CDA1 family)
MTKRKIGVLLVGIFTALCFQAPAASQPPSLTWDRGAAIRGDLSRKRIALIFTGGDYGEGTTSILDTLRQFHIKAGFFVTGGYLRQPGHPELVRRALREGHYVGPHSDQHPLYCSWERRDETLISRQQFETDLRKNIDDLRRLGALQARQTYFIPPYEWFNQDQTEWARAMNVRMFNFSPGSGSNRDYMPESDPHFVSSQKILEGILEYEKKDSHGLNGYILLLHLGADRKDKMFRQLTPLILALQKRGYDFIRIDQMLKE